MNILRPYSLELWSLSDRPILSLRSAYKSFPGQAYGATLEIKSDGTINFSCSIPMKYYEPKTGELVKNSLWFDEIGDKAHLTNFKKVKVIIYEKGLGFQPTIHEIVITEVNEARQDNSLVCSISGSGLAFYELGRIGKNITINTDTIEGEVEDGLISLVDIYNDQGQIATPATLINLNYYLDKVFLNHEDGANTVWDTPWQYEIRMDWSKYPDITTRVATKAYEDPAPSYYELISGQLQPKGYKFDEEKQRFIEISASNKYNITQDLAEAFEVFVRYEYGYNYDTFEITSRKVIFYNDYVQKNIGTSPNFTKVEINYGKNLDTITKTANSTETITKMYVKDIESSTSSSGIISISDAANNPLKDNFIIDFSYLIDQGILNAETEEYVDTYKLKLYDVNKRLQICLNNTDTYQKIENDLKTQTGILQNQITAAQEMMDNADSKMAATDFTGTGTETNPFPDQVIATADPKPYMFFGTGSPATEFNIILTTARGLKKSTLNAYTTFTSGTLSGQFISNGAVIGTNLGVTVLTDSYGFVTGIKVTNLSTNKLPIVNGAELPATQKLWLTYTYNVIGYYLEEKKYYVKIKDNSTAQLNAIYAVVDNEDHYKNGTVDITAKLTDLTEDYKLLVSEKQSLNDDFEKVMGLWVKEGEYTSDEYNELGYEKEQLIVGATSITNHDFSSSQDQAILFYDNLSLTGEQENNDGASTPVYYPYCAWPSIVSTWDWNDTQVEVKYQSGANELTYILTPGSDYFFAYVKPASTYNPIMFFRTLEVPQASYSTINKITFYRMTNFVTDDANKVVLYDKTVAESSNLLKINTAVTAYTVYRKRITIASPSINTDSIVLSHTKISAPTEYETLTAYKVYEKNYIGLFPTMTLKPSSLFSVSDQNFKATFKTVYSAEHLYSDAKVVMEENKKPRVTYDVSVNALNIEDQEKMKLGYVVFINDPDMGFFGEQGIITGVQYDLEEPEKDTITVSNYKTRFEDLFGKIVASTEQMKTSGYTYERAAAAVLPTGQINAQILQNTFTNQQMQMMYSNGSVVIDKNGITLYSKK